MVNHESCCVTVRDCCWLCAAGGCFRVSVSACALHIKGVCKGLGEKDFFHGVKAQIEWEKSLFSLPHIICFRWIDKSNMLRFDRLLESTAELLKIVQKWLRGLIINSC